MNEVKKERQDEIKHEAFNFFIQRLSQKNLSEAWKFLKKYEKTSIALFSHLVEKKTPKMPKAQFQYFLILQNRNSSQYKNLHKKKQRIIAVFMISKSGLIFHQFAENLERMQNENLIELEKILQKENIYSVIGTKKGTEFFQSYIKKAQGLEPRTEILYDYLIYSETQKKKLDSQKIGRRIFPSEFQSYLKWNTIDDLESLSPLQALYDKQEVIPPFKDFDSLLSKSNLKRLLLTEKIMSLEKEGEYIAKAGSNAQGLDWVQIGGVCTKTTERNRGYAQFLVENLVNYFRKTEHKNVALFVKENNDSAKKAYQNLGFVFDSYFKIVYY